jgi:TolA-binding protein
VDPIEKFREGMQRVLQTNQAIERAKTETAQRVQSALKAQIGLPEQIDRLTGEIEKLVEVSHSQKQLAQELLGIADAQNRLAAEAGKQAESLSNQTEKLVSETIILRRFTKGVFWLTVVISIFTLVQIIITCLDYSTKAHEGIKSGVDKETTQNNQTP